MQNSEDSNFSDEKIRGNWRGYISDEAMIRHDEQGDTALSPYVRFSRRVVGLFDHPAQ